MMRQFVLHSHGPVTLPVSFEQVQPIMGKAHRFRGAGDIELGEDHFHAILHIWTYEAAVTTLIQALEPTMSETPNHCL